MKIYSKFYDPIDIEKKITNEIGFNDFSLFIDIIPQHQFELSSYNILVLAEPNEYFGLHDWAINNYQIFDVIMTWSDKVLFNCPNSTFLPFGSSWFTKEQYLSIHEKKFEVSHLCGTLLKSYGHQMRHEILARKQEIHLPVNFYSTIGNRHDENDARIGKEIVFGNSQYGIAIENFSHRGYFSEKILDCFLMKTIPIYNGCSNIGDYFNINGIICFSNVDDLIFKLNNIKEGDYQKLQNIIEENYQISIKYIDYINTIAIKLAEIFKYNNL